MVHYDDVKVAKKAANDSHMDDFRGEHKKDDIYTASTTRPIDVVMELFTMLKGDKLYGQPGTDGTFWSNILEAFKNDNDVLSVFKLNKAHPFNKTERITFLALSIFLNLVINSSMGAIESQIGISPTLVSILVSVVLVVVKKLLRLLFEAPCMSHDAAASDLRDNTDSRSPDEIVEENEKKQKQLQAPIRILIQIAASGIGVGGIAAAYSNFEILSYILTFACNVILFSVLNTAFLVATGRYEKDREEFETKWGALQYNGKYLHPRSISDVAKAVVEHAGGLENALKHLDTKSQENFEAYFYMNSSGQEEMLSTECVDGFKNNLSCMTVTEEKYLARFDGRTRLNPYSLESKGQLYGSAIEMQNTKNLV